MSWPLLFLINIIIGGLIGGVTNELAIRMLFRPYRAVYLFGWRIPFTPGLIPKRHEELAQQMGKLVENFLITPQGIRNMLQKGAVDKEIEGWILSFVERTVHSEDRLHTLMERWGIEGDGQLSEKLQRYVVFYASNKLNQMSGETLEELLPNELKNALETRFKQTAPFFLEKMGQYIESVDGSMTIRKMLSQLSGGLGVFGGIAGMFLNDEKVTVKVAASLSQALKSEELAGKLGDILQKELRQLYSKKVDEIIQWIGTDAVEGIIERAASSLVDIKGIMDKKPGEILEPVLPTLREAVPGVVTRLMDWGMENLEKGLKKVNLTQIAAEQVRSFPVNTLEDMIVSITGKELKMITVLGALLGALIGGIQAALNLLWR